MPEPAVAEAEPDTEAVAEVEAEVEPEPADLDAEIAAGAMAGAENARSSTGLPPELAFLDTPAEAEEETPEVEAETETEAAAELPEPEQVPEPEPVAAKPINPFPTIPESVRKSVMAAASRAVPPELAGEFPDDAASADEASADTANKDVATTTLGDLAQRLEKALTEQANPGKDAVASGEAEPAQAEAGSEAETDDEEDAEGHDDGAVIDFSARRKEEPVDELEDEMARLLNDLTGDTGRAGK
jgi:hypothetical protein